MRGKKPKSNSKVDDWKAWNKGWPYKGDAPNDPEYLKDRNKLFQSNGIGWWWDQGKKHWKDYYENSRKRR